MKPTSKTNKENLKPCPRTLCPVATTLELISGKLNFDAHCGKMPHEIPSNQTKCVAINH